MDDDALLDALFMGLNVMDPPPPSLREAAMQAHAWGSDYSLLEEVGRQDRELVDVGMRSLAAPVDYQFDGDGHELYVTVEVGSDAPKHHGMIRPPVDRITVLVSNGDKFDVECDEHGRFNFVPLTDSPVALSFVTSAEARFRTPILGPF